MPELPEVETVRRGLSRARLRAPIVRIWRSKKPLRIGATWRRENLRVLDGARPVRVGRRGKYLVWGFERPGVAPLGLVVHLGMTGRLCVCRPDDPREAHTHLVLRFADDREVRFVDPRRFGGLRADTMAQLRTTAPLCDLGPEPLARRRSGYGPSARFDAAALQSMAERSQRVIRDVLLDQRIVAGVGNIYALEALFEAGVHPLTPACRLDDAAWPRLAEAVRSVLRRGIQNGGTTFRDYRDSSGRRGRNQQSLWVYGRAGQPCRRCGTTLASFTHGGRSGVVCPHEQRRR